MSIFEQYLGCFYLLADALAALLLLLAADAQVMEVLELPRATALELLVDHGGDAQAVILAVFGA